MGSFAQQQVVEILALLGRQDDGHAAPLRAQPPGSGLGGPQASPGGVVVGQDQHAPDSEWQIDLFETRRGECRPDRQLGARGHHREAGLDPFGKRQPIAVVELGQTHRATRDPAEHLPGLVEWCLADCLFLDGEVAAMQADDRAVAVADLSQHGRVGQSKKYP